jgi:hypothetical protein
MEATVNNGIEHVPYVAQDNDVLWGTLGEVKSTECDWDDADNVLIE